MFPERLDLIAAPTMTRPNDSVAYASGDLVANSTSAGAVVPLVFADAARGPGYSARVRRVRIRKSGTNVTNAAFRLHLYAMSPTPANGDNAAWSTNRSADYLGSIDVTIDRAFTDGAAGAATCDISHVQQIVYGLIEARAAYTPAAQESFAVTLEIEQQ